MLTLHEPVIPYPGMRTLRQQEFDDYLVIAESMQKKINELSLEKRQKELSGPQNVDKLSVELEKLVNE